MDKERGSEMEGWIKSERERERERGSRGNCALDFHS